MTLKNRFAFYTVCCFLFAAPLINNGIYYRDDIFRSVTGVSYWDAYGRNLANWVAYALSLTNKAVIDSYPLGIIIAISSVIFIFYFIIRNNLASKDESVLFPLPLLFISPVFIQNISYRYDSAGMVLSLCMVIAAFFISNESNKIHRVIAVILIIISLFLYQPSANVYLGLMACHCITKIKSSSLNRFDSLLKDSLCFASSYVIYFTLVKYIIGDMKGNRSDIIQIHDIPESIIKVIKQTVDILSTINIGFISYALYSIIFLFFLGLVLDLKKHLTSHGFRLNILDCLLVVTSSPLLFLFSIIGISFLIKEGITDVRVLVGLSPLVYILGVVICRMNIKVGMASVISMIFIITTLSFQFSNALKLQREYEERILQNVSMDYLSRNHTAGDVYVVGNIPVDKSVELMVKYQPFIGLILSPMEPWMSSPKLINFGINNSVQSWPEVEKQQRINICSNNIRPISSNHLFDVYKYNNNLIYWFKGKQLTC